MEIASSDRELKEAVPIARMSHIENRKMGSDDDVHYKSSRKMTNQGRNKIFRHEL
jgi:hypothetical protein